MKAHNQVQSYVTKAALLLLLMAGEARPLMDILQGKDTGRSNSFECCTHIDDVRIATLVNLSELRGIGADPAGVSAPSPSGACRMHIHVRRARLSAMHTRDGGVGAGMLVDLDVQVKGPSPICDGSFAHVKVWDPSNGVEYRSAFSYWGGWLHITTVKDAATAPPDHGDGEGDGGGGGGGGGGRLRRHTIVLPAEGSYWLEVLYDSEMYTGFLDKFEGMKLPLEKREMLQPARTAIDPWLDVPASFFNQTMSASSPGCDCDVKHRWLYKSWPGYWAKNRTLYVPLFHPQVNRWAAPPVGRRCLDDGAHGPDCAALELMIDKVPGGLMILGNSRQRTLHFDMLGMLGLGSTFEPFKAELSSFVGWTGATTGTRASFTSQHGKIWGNEEATTRETCLHCSDYTQHLLAALDGANLCTKTSMKSVVIYSEGSQPAAMMRGPRGLNFAASFIHETLSMLAKRCKGTKTTLMVASEMACHDHWEPSSNSFRDNRIVGINAAVKEIASMLELRFIDVYPMSLSAGESRPYQLHSWGGWVLDVHHYWSRYAVGDEVSVAAALAYFDAISDALDADSDSDHLGCSLDIIEPFDGQCMQLRLDREECADESELDKTVDGANETAGKVHGDASRGHCSSANRRNVSIIVATSDTCMGATGAAVSSSTLPISVDGKMLSAREQKLIKTQRGTSKIVVLAVAELGEGSHVITAACAVPGCQEEVVSRFELVPYNHRHTSRIATTEVESFDDIDDGGPLDVVHTSMDDYTDSRRLAITMCFPPRLHAECIIQANRVMDSSTPYDNLVLSSDCGWAKDPTHGLTRVMQWRLKSLYASLAGTGSSVFCMERRVYTLEPCSVWGVLFGGFHFDPQFEDLSMYQSMVLISPGGVEDAMEFDLDGLRKSMWHAGAHVAIPSVLNSHDTAGRGEQQRVVEHDQDAGYCVRWTCGTSLRCDPPIIVMTSSSWECMWRQLAVAKRSLISPHLTSVLCSPRGALSACNMAQSCILVDHMPIKILPFAHHKSEEGKRRNVGSAPRTLPWAGVGPYPYGIQRVGLCYG